MITPDKLMDLARSLLDGQPDEAACRAAISRAYYALYHEVGAIIKSKHLQALMKYLNNEYTNMMPDRAKVEVCDSNEMRRYNLHKDYAIVLGKLIDNNTEQKFKTFVGKRHEADYDLSKHKSKFDKVDSSDLVNAIVKFLGEIKVKLCPQP